MRLRADLKFGTITDNPLAIGATTINSAQFATLPTVAGFDELFLTLDPEGSNREIVRVTAHAAAATVVTVQRGQLNTAAAQHALTTRWVHGAITTDLPVPCTSTTRPTLGLWAGMEIHETDTNLRLFHTGSGWRYCPGQVLGFAEVTADQTGIGVDTDLTGLAVTFDSFGHPVFLCSSLKLVHGTSANEVAMVCREGITQIEELLRTTLGAGESITGHFRKRTTPPAGSHTYKLTATQAGGTTSLGATATNRAQFWIESA